MGRTSTKAAEAPAGEVKAPKQTKVKTPKTPKQPKAPKEKKPKVPGTGNTPMFTDPVVMQEKIDAYFTACEGQLLTDPDTGKPFLDKWGHPVYIGVKPPTVTGLALALGFTNRVSLLNYQAKPEFEAIITRAKSRVEEYAETRLYDRDGANGARFTLMCNFGWKESRDKEAEGGAVVRIVCDIPRSKVESADGGYTQESGPDQAGVSKDGTDAA